jgi:1-deoxy-D-xylulose 5-phosphate reductoisomerase
VGQAIGMTGTVGTESVTVTPDKPSKLSVTEQDNFDKFNNSLQTFFNKRSISEPSSHDTSYLEDLKKFIPCWTPPKGDKLVFTIANQTNKF